MAIGGFISYDHPMLRKISALAIASLALVSCSAQSSEPTPEQLGLVEIANSTERARTNLFDSLQKFHTEGCRWGYGNITSSSREAQLCYAVMTSLPSKAKLLDSSMFFATSDDEPGSDTDLVQDTIRIANALQLLSGDMSEKDDFESLSSEAMEALEEWNSISEEK